MSLVDTVSTMVSCPTQDITRFRYNDLGVEVILNNVNDTVRVWRFQTATQPLSVDVFDGREFSQYEGTIRDFLKLKLGI